MVRKLLIRILVTALALWAADYLLAGFSVSGGVPGYVVAGAILGLLNTLVRPVLKLIAAPLILLTLGLFTLVINAGLLWLSAELTGSIVIADLAALALATLIVTAANIIFET
jgi:putative membrane protein